MCFLAFIPVRGGVARCGAFWQPKLAEILNASNENKPIGIQLRVKTKKEKLFDMFLNMC